MKKIGSDLNIAHTYICIFIISINVHKTQHVLLFQLKNVRCNFGDKYFFDVSRFRLNIPPSNICGWCRLGTSILYRSSQFFISNFKFLLDFLMFLTLFFFCFSTFQFFFGKSETKNRIKKVNFHLDPKI